VEAAKVGWLQAEQQGSIVIAVRCQRQVRSGGSTVPAMGRSGGSTVPAAVVIVVKHRACLSVGR
jgi:hypothetical protein